VCAYRLAGKLATERRYLRHLLDRRASDRVFALTLLRLLTAYRTGSMRYGLFVFDRPR
jgi:tocopherol O-methyltransferase